jgi:regulator of replication initiation timing
MVGAAYNGLKFAKDALKLSLDLKIESESRAQVHTALEKLGAVQDSLFALREELFSLQNENEQLRQELKSQQDWESIKENYQLQTTSGGAVIYRFLGEPEHYACPSCFQNRSLQILQDCRVRVGTFECPGCKTKYPVKPVRAQPTISYGGGRF